jgi:MFS superfamily sulfate permease-like transporter
MDQPTSVIVSAVKRRRGAINMDGFVHNLQNADGHLSGSAEKDIMPIHIRVDVTLPSVMICSFKAPLSYANAEFFMHEVLSFVKAAPPSPRWFILRFDSIGEVDYVAAKMLMELADRMEREQVTLGFTGLSPDLRGFLSDSGVLDVIGSDKVFASVHEASTPIKNSALSDGQAPKL